MSGWQPSPALAGPLYGKDSWPLRFHTHGFAAHCWNTLSCSLIYNRHQFGRGTYGPDGQYHGKPSGPPPSPDWKDHLTGSHGILPEQGKTFPWPVEVKWIALDGSQHEASIDLDAIFKDRLILHRAKKEEIPPVYLLAYTTEPISPEILFEVNDRTINVYMRATVVVGAPENLDDLDKRDVRDDLILAWAHTY